MLKALSVYSTFSKLECPRCGHTAPRDHVASLCTECGSPLFARYDLNAARENLVDAREPGLWRYHAVLPVFDSKFRIYLGEGMTPLIHAQRLGAKLGFTQLFLKEESRNPTDSFKARGMAVAVSKAKELGIKKLAAPSAGNAGSALAAYAAAAGLEAHIVMPKDTPRPIVEECRALGADVRLIDGLISDAGRVVRERAESEGWFDVATFKEPYRAEGKKTMGYELWEQMERKLPDVIIYPTGGGTGLVGMSKAFAELAEMNVLAADSPSPKFVAVQATGCAPVIKSFDAGVDSCEMWENAETYASGLRVPKPLADYLILRALRESRGTALAITDDAMRDATKLLGAREGVFASPEAAATVAALAPLRENGFIAPETRVVLFITGGGLKYIE
ncbi:MAG: threonine synthase [Chloroflexi bacterium]|nr:threonine synthase [Chloroflexota bacterium]